MTLSSKRTVGVAAGGRHTASPSAGGAEPTPFDASPRPLERGDRPRRIVVNIEIVDRRQRSPRGYRFGTFTPALFVVLLIAAFAHGEIRYVHWHSTDGLHGEIRQEGGTTDWTDYGPTGQQHRCHRYFVGDQAFTNCTGH